MGCLLLRTARNSPSLRVVTMPRDCATEHAQTVFSVHSNNSVLTSPWDDSPPTYNHARTTTPDVFDLPPPVTTPHDLATEYTPTLYSAFSHYLAPTSPEDYSQTEETYPDHARTMTPNVDPSYSALASGHCDSIEVGPTPYVLHPSVPTPVVARFQDLSAYWGPKDISSGNDALFAAGRSSAPPFRRTVQRHGLGEGMDRTQWWGLVRSAATKP